MDTIVEHVTRLRQQAEAERVAGLTNTASATADLADAYEIAHTKEPTTMSKYADKYTGKHISISEMDIEITCPSCGEKEERIWSHGNRLELIHSYTCDCGEDIEVMFMIGATLTTSSDVNEEAWL